MGNNQQSVTQLQEGWGYRIIHIFKNSPGDKAKLFQYIDYIIDIGDQNEKEKDFFQIVNDSEDKEIQFTVYNLVSKSTRQVKLTPSKNWENSENSLLGIQLRYENYQNTNDLVFKVLSVLPNSPVEKAGMQKDVDYIIGLLKFKYNNMGEMIDQIVGSEFSEQKYIELIIFNSETRQTRVVQVYPNFKWGGKGSLGVEFGSGFLNQIPQINLLQLQQVQNYETNKDEKLKQERSTQSTQYVKGIIEEDLPPSEIPTDEKELNSHIENIVNQRKNSEALMYNLQRKRSMQLQRKESTPNNSKGQIQQNPFEQQNKSVEQINPNDRQTNNTTQGQIRRSSKSHTETPQTNQNVIDKNLSVSQNLKEINESNSEFQKKVSSQKQQNQGEQQKLMSNSQYNNQEQKQTQNLSQQFRQEDENIVRVCKQDNNQNIYAYFCKKISEDYTICQEQLFDLSVSISFRPTVYSLKI